MSDDDENYIWGYYGFESDTERKSTNNSTNSFTSAKDDIYKYRERIKEISKTGMISKDQKKEIEELEKKIGSLRSNCNHNWEIVIMFQLPRRFCRRCDQEDFAYNHNAD